MTYIKDTNTNIFDIRNNGFKPEKKQILKKFTCKFSIDYCDQSLSDNLYIKLCKDCLMKIDHSSQSKIYK